MSVTGSNLANDAANDADECTNINVRHAFFAPASVQLKASVGAAWQNGGWNH